MPVYFTLALLCIALYYLNLTIVYMKLIQIGRYSGPTIHFVDEKYDHGIILAQRVVPVLPYDTADDLAARVLKEVHILTVFFLRK